MVTECLARAVLFTGIETFAGITQVEMRALLRRLRDWKSAEETIVLQHLHAKWVMAMN
jgi:hypothetical protein